jgi:hypothetical protein
VRRKDYFPRLLLFSNHFLTILDKIKRISQSLDSHSDQFYFLTLTTFLNKEDEIFKYCKYDKLDCLQYAWAF